MGRWKNRFRKTKQKSRFVQLANYNKKNSACHWIFRKSGYKKLHKFLKEKSEKKPEKHDSRSEGHSEIIDTPFPLPSTFPNENERFIHQLEVHCVKVFTAEVESFFRPS